jgi:ubiquitin C-terminal hydrolase
MSSVAQRANKLGGLLRNDAKLEKRVSTRDKLLGPDFNTRDCGERGPHTGLHNQGATCYMNSVLQALFFTRELRQAYVITLSTMLFRLSRALSLSLSLSHSLSRPLCVSHTHTHNTEK